MGAQQSSAAITQENNITTVNKSTIDLLSKQINKTTSDTIINQSTSCAATANTTLMALFSDIIAKGDINIDNTMNNKVSINISCVNSSTIGAAVGAQVKSDMSAQLDTVFKNMASQVASGTANASTSAGGIFPSLMGQVSSSDVKQYNTATTTNDAKTKVESIIENIVASTLTTNVMNDLKAAVISQMSATFKNLQAGGNVNINNLMESTTQIIAEQVVNMGIGSQVTQKLESVFGIKVKNDVETTVTQASKAESIAKADSPSILSGLFSGLFSGFGSGSPGSSTMSIISCVLCIILLVLSLAMKFMGGSSSGGEE